MALHALTDLANWGLQKIPGAYAHLEDVEIKPLRGRITFVGVQGKMTPAHGSAAEIHVARCNISIQWRALLRGKLITDIVIERPQVTVMLPPPHQKPAPPKKPEHPLRRMDDKTWQDKVRELFPFRIRRLQIEHASLYLQNVPGQNGTDLRINEWQLIVRNITNSEALGGTLQASALMEGKLMSHGWFHLDAQGYPLANFPTFNVDFELHGLKLDELRPLIRHWAQADVRQGSVSAFLEMAAAQGGVKGYLKPILDHVDIGKSRPGFGQTLKIAAAKVVAGLLRNRSEHRIATRVEFYGRLDKPDVKYSSAISNLLKNAFSKAFSPHLEHSIRFLKEGKHAEDVEISLPGRKPGRLAAFFSLVKESVKDWSENKIPRRSAALSYYTAFSIAPLLLLTVAIVGLVFGRRAVQGELVGQIGGMVGRQAAQTIQSMMAAAAKRSSGIGATIIGLISLLAGASGVMSELKDSLNQLWHVKEPTGLGATIKGMVMSYAMVLAIGFVLLVSLALSAATAAAGHFLGGVLPIPEFVMHLLNLLISFGVVTLLFALIYKILPDTSIRWKDVWIGSAVTALLFSIGKTLIGLYLGKASVSSSYGAAGSVLVSLLWVYYSAMILYFGAAFTKVYADRYGSRKTQHPEIPWAPKYRSQLGDTSAESAKAA